MKHLKLLLISIAIPLSLSHAQIRTGGVDEPADTSWMKIEEGLQRFEEHLIKRDKFCSQTQKLKKGQSLFDMYLILSIKQTQDSGVACDENKAYLACLNDKTTSNMVKEYVTHPRCKIGLVAKHQLSNKQADDVVKFFVELPKPEK